MRVRNLAPAILAVASVGLCGCPLVLVGAGVAGGYAISKDAVRNQFDLSKDAVYRQSLAVAKQMGQVTLEDMTHGVIELKVGDAHVTITVKPLTKKTVELKVKARNQFLMPQVDVAQQVYNKIIERL